MGRINRRDLPPGFFHITARAVVETALFRDAEDRRTFLVLLRRGVKRFELRLDAYCLMGTHYHAVVDTSPACLSRAFQWLHTIYAQEFNQRYERRGHLFSERFSSWVIRDEDHLRAAIEYVLANPVRAGLVDHPRAWPWSWSNHG